MKINIIENLVCKKDHYLNVEGEDIVLVANRFQFHIKKLNDIDWVHIFYWIKNFHLNNEKKPVLDFQSMSIFHITNDDKKYDYAPLKEGLLTHEIENNSFIKQEYFSKLEGTDHLFFSLLENDVDPENYRIDNWVLDEAQKKGIDIS